MARTAALVYLGVVALAGVPFVLEISSGADTDGSFTLVWLMLATAPLSLLTIMLVGTVATAGEIADWPLTGNEFDLLITVPAFAATALIQAWAIWYLVRGPAIERQP
jgi:hypothetical protein